MLRTLVDEKYTGQVDVLHFCRDSTDNPYRVELVDFARRPGFRVDCVYTRAGGRHLNAEHLADFGDVGLACGPAALLASAKELYAEAGVPLLTEEFTAPVTAAPSAEAAGTLRFVETGVQADNDGRTILDQAESAGLRPDSGCRMGICFSCTAVRRSGCTTNVLTGEVDSEPDQHIQLCISAPVGDVDIAL